MAHPMPMGNERLPQDYDGGEIDPELEADIYWQEKMMEDDDE